jgi:uncharacterized C2H2 Zn-finger protein
VHILKLYGVHNKNGGRAPPQAKCTVCDRVFVSDDALRNHARAKHGKDQAILAHWRRYSSQQSCGALAGDTITTSPAASTSASAFALGSSAAASEEGAADSNTAVRCSICNCTYPNQASYRKHFVSLEPIVKKTPHPCPGCDKIFGDARALRQHMNFCSGAAAAAAADGRAAAVNFA